MEGLAALMVIQVLRRGLLYALGCESECEQRPFCSKTISPQCCSSGAWKSQNHSCFENRANWQASAEKEAEMALNGLLRTQVPD